VRFVVDNQLPPRISRFLADRGHDAVHVSMIGLDTADDQSLWAWALRESRVLVSKDEDFVYLAHRRLDRGRLLWVRLGNCRREAILLAFDRSIETIVAAFESGERVVELS
jgi:predicted nuclease of predicted toxin-antitoxin system